MTSHKDVLLLWCPHRFFKRRVTLHEELASPKPLTESLTGLFNKQEDLLDLITALLKFNCFLSTTVATQSIFQSNL